MCVVRPKRQRTITSRFTAGFTLVEILIVVIILGILATIIIGLIGNTTADAARNSLKDNLRQMRSALQIYVAHHGAYPTVGAFESQMTQYTNTAGATSVTRDSTHPFGPYVLALPMLPVGAERGKTAVTTMTYSAGYGWGYDPTAGNIRANCPDSEVDSDGVKYNTY